MEKLLKPPAPATLAAGLYDIMAKKGKADLEKARHEEKVVKRNDGKLHGVAGYIDRWIGVIVLASLVILGTFIGVLIWKLESHDHPNSFTIGSAHFVIKQNQLGMTLRNAGQTTGVGLLGFNIPENEPKICTRADDSLCLDWENDRRVTINMHTTPDVTCYDVTWEALACTSQELKDCFNMSFAHWYGGFEDFNQYWPINTLQKKMAPYVTNETMAVNDTFGSVQDRYFISSNGVGLHVEWDVPLHLSLNPEGDGMMCLSAKYDSDAYFNHANAMPVLNYTICQANNVVQLHKAMSEKFIPKPSKIPDVKMFKYPIWSTWALYKKDINQSQVLDFARDININGFSHAQLEIDDSWTSAYGDMDFDQSKFPNAAAMIRQLNKDGFRVTLWIHPFFNLDSKSFFHLAEKEFLVKSFQRDTPALVSWWDGKLAGILDVTNPGAVDWFVEQTKYLRKTYNISSFKLDAGEVKWLPKMYSTFEPLTSPNDFSKKWAELGYSIDPNVRHQEVRVGSGSQSFPVFLRMFDKESSWSHDNGMKSIIPAALTFGLLGYPFILPDIIGGNAYGNQTNAFPDSELFIRWIQMNTFLPSMQLSIPPWIYNSTVREISAKFVKLHGTYSSLFIKLAENSVTTGEPIIRPLWWIAPEDDIALTTDTEFLVGNKILVAPVLEQGARSRDIYLPKGLWNDVLRKEKLTGGRWYRGYSADLHELPFFVKIN